MAILGRKLFKPLGLLVTLRKRSGILADFKPQNIFTRFHGSALFVSGKDANQNFAVLTPCLDFKEHFSDLDKLKSDLSLRGMNIDVKSMKMAWDFYKYTESVRSRLEKQRTNIAEQIKVYSKKDVQTDEDQLEITKLKTQGISLREDLKVVREALWELEEVVVKRVLKLPNVLHNDTPHTDPLILHSYGNEIRVSENETPLKSHVDIGKSLGLLEYSNPMNYYLLKEAALFELAAIRLCANILSNNNITRVTGLDFSRSVVVEGSGLDHEDPEESFTLKDNEELGNHSSNRLHLVGGASLASFLGMHTKQLINPNDFPIRYFASGRQYVPFSNRFEESGLFTVCQSTAVQVFTLHKGFTDLEHTEEFERIITSVKLIYDSLCSHYRVVVRPAKELKPWESLRLSFELWSPYLSKYVEVGHLSLCGEYFSKRLLIGCQTPQGRKYPHVISGTILSIPRLLACLLEESPEKFNVPVKVLQHMLL